MIVNKVFIDKKGILWALRAIGPCCFVRDDRFKTYGTDAKEIAGFVCWNRCSKPGYSILLPCASNISGTMHTFTGYTFLQIYRSGGGGAGECTFQVLY